MRPQMRERSLGARSRTSLPFTALGRYPANVQMNTGAAKALHYKRSHFATQLPVNYLYTSSHAWIAEQEPGLWRIGLTKFATRMLGEMVDHGFEIEDNASVA